MRAVSRPRRRWVGRAPTAVTPGADTVVSPGSVSSMAQSPAVATMRPSSKAARCRSFPVAAWMASMSSFDTCWPKGMCSTRTNSANSSGATGRISKSIAPTICRLGGLPDQLDPLLHRVGVVALRLEQRLAIALGLVGRAGVGGGQAGFHALGHQPFGLLEQGADHVGLGHDADHLSLDEEVAIAPAGGDAEVGPPGLAGTVAH